MDNYFKPMLLALSIFVGVIILFGSFIASITR